MAGVAIVCSTTNSWLPPGIVVVPSVVSVMVVAPEATVPVAIGVASPLT